MATTKRTLTVNKTESGLHHINMPDSLSVGHHQAPAAWAYFIGALSSAATRNAWEKGPEVRRSIDTIEIIELMERAAEFAKKQS